MKIKRYLFLIFAITFLAFGSWFVVLNNLNPFNENWRAMVLFLILLVGWLWGVATFINYYIRIRRSNYEIVYQNLIVASRQGILIAIGIGGLLTLQVLDVFNAMSAGVWLFALILVEFYFKGRAKVEKAK